MSSARPVAGVGLQHVTQFGQPRVTNLAATVAPRGFDLARLPITSSIYYTDQNGAAVWFGFDATYQAPNNLNAAFTFGGSSGIGGAGLPQKTQFGIASAANRAQLIATEGIASKTTPTPRLWHQYSNSGGSSDFSFSDNYVHPPNGNTAFYFGGTMVVAAVSIGHTTQFGDIQDVEQPLQIQPIGFTAPNRFGQPRLGDQPAVEFRFDTTTDAKIKGANAAFNFGVGQAVSATAGNQSNVGIANIQNTAQRILVRGYDASSPGVARTFDIDSNGALANFGFVQSYKAKPSALNTPFYFAWESRAITEGWQSEQWGEPYTWLFHSFADPTGWRSTKFGNTHIENWAEFAATPVGIAATGFGSASVESADRFLLALAGKLTGLSVSEGTITYQSKTDRPTTSQQQTHWQISTANQTASAQQQQDTQRMPSGWVLRHGQGNNQTQPINHPLPPTLVAADLYQTEIEKASTQHHVDHTIAQQGCIRYWLHRPQSYQNPSRLRTSSAFEQQDANRLIRADQAHRWQLTKRHDAHQYGGHASATTNLAGWNVIFQNTRVPPIGLSARVTDQPPALVECYARSSDLVFATLPTTHGHLLFQCDTTEVKPPTGSTLIIPIQKVYIVLNNVNLMRASDQTLVPTYTMSLSLDSGSWAWGFEASLPGVAQGLVEPNANGPVELIANVNGNAFRVLAESLNRERVFGETRIRVSGRSKHALLDAPYAPILSFNNTADRSHQQLFDDVLQINVVPLGWQIDYGLESWNVPLGAFAHRGTYISALAALAKAGGAYLLPDTQQQLFKVVPHYPATPWNWGEITPDVVLPVDAVSRESISWKEKPAYNRVYVSGEGQGILGQVTRSGTAGDILAPMVTDSLITTAAAARQRGLAILSDTGRQLEMGLKLPVLPTTGIIQPGAFVQYDNDGTSSIGLVRSTHIDVGLPDVFQTLGVECHA
jgi:hypothetical protein